MATSKTKKPATAKKQSNIIARAKQRASDLRERRPHRSFRLTRRRDIPKPPKLPGYIQFTGKVFSTIFEYNRLFVPLILLYTVISMLLLGAATTQQYAYLTESLQQAGSNLVGSQAIGVFGSAISGGLNASLGEAQQLYLGILYLVMWLVVIWLLRQSLAGNTIKLRDALYNACAPFVSTLLIVLLMIVQVLPAVIGILVLSIASQQAIVTGVIAMLFSVFAFLLVLLSLYWLASSFFALLIVTLPGTYPMAAIRAAGDIALGRRVPLMFRLLWLCLILLLIWAVVLIPVLVVDAALNISLSAAPLLVQALTGFSLVYAATYFYLLYRGMIDERTD